MSDDEVDAPVADEAVLLHISPQVVPSLLQTPLVDISVHCLCSPYLLSPSCWSGSATVNIGLDSAYISANSRHLALSCLSGGQLTVVGSFVAHLVIGSAECPHQVSLVRGLQCNCLVCSVIVWSAVTCCRRFRAPLFPIGMGT